MTRKLTAMAVLAVAPLTLAAGPAPELWHVDVPHTGIEFSVKHFFTPVKGVFEDYSIELMYDREAPAHSTVKVEIDVTSVNTGNERRDDHLRSADFFEADRYPTITFESEQVWLVAADELLVRGPLTIKGETRTVDLPVKILGVMDVAPEMKEMLGGVSQIASFQAQLQIDRGDYEVGVGSWATNVIVGNEVDIDIAVEANR